MEKKLSYEEFMEYCVKNLGIVLKSDYEVKANKVHRTDEWVIDSFSVQKIGKEKIKTLFEIHSKDIYLEYVDGKSLGDVILDIINEIEKEFGKKIDIKVDLEQISEYSYMKDKLIIRAISYTDNKNLLKNHYFRRIEDIALVLYVEAGNSSRGYATMKIPVTSMKGWDLEEAYETAMENTVKNNIPVFSPMELLYSGDSIPASKKYLMNENYNFRPSILNTYRLSTDASINGAMAVFFPGVLKRVAKILNDDFYVVFLSIHEGMIHPMKKFDKSSLLSRAGDTKSINVMNAAEYLSSNLFAYYRDKETLELAEL